MSDFVHIMGFGADGWGLPMLRGAGITLAIAVSGFLLGAIIGAFGAWGKISGGRPLRRLLDGYTTAFRGIPDLLVIYLFYFGSGLALTPLANLFGADGFVSLPGFLAGIIAVGITSGAYQTEVFRGGYRAVFHGEIEAATAYGMSQFLKFRRVIAPLTLRYSLPALGNVWQQVLKETALVSVTGAVELVRQAQIGAGSTYKPFTFYFGACILYLAITIASSHILARSEQVLGRGMARP